MYEFVHIPKTGGASCHAVFKDIPNIKPNYARHNLQIKDIFKKNSNSDIIICLRNVYNWVISIYNYNKLHLGNDYKRDRFYKETSKETSVDQEYYDDLEIAYFAHNWIHKNKAFKSVAFKYYFEDVDLDDPRINVLFTETLGEDISLLLKKIHNTEHSSIEVPQFHKTQRVNPILSDELKNTIDKLFEDEIKIYNYFLDKKMKNCDI